MVVTTAGWLKPLCEVLRGKVEEDKLAWYIDEVLDDFLEALHGYMYERFVFDDDTCEQSLKALEDIRACGDKDIANNMYDRNGVQLCWVVRGELRVKYMCASECMMVRSIVSEGVDIQEFVDAYPGWCKELFEPFIPNGDY